MEDAFHGRTMGALALTAKAAYREPFEPLPGDVTWVPVRRRRRPRGRRRRHDRRRRDRAAPGRGRRQRRRRRLPPLPPASSPPPAVRCCGSTRCRAAWAAPATGSPATPAASPPTSSRSPRASPAGCRSAPCSASAAAGSLLEPGNHGTTFGGNPVACAAALAVIDTIEADGLLQRATDAGERLRSGLAADPRVLEVRGEGVLVGLTLSAAKAPRRRRRRPAGRLHPQRHRPGPDPVRAAARRHRRPGRRLSSLPGRASSTPRGCRAP